MVPQQLQLIACLLCAHRALCEDPTLLAEWSTRLVSWGRVAEVNRHLTVLLAAGDEGKSTQLTYVVHSSIGGWLPASLVNKGTVTTLWDIMHCLPEAVKMEFA